MHSIGEVASTPTSLDMNVGDNNGGNRLLSLLHFSWGGKGKEGDLDKDYSSMRAPFTMLHTKRTPQLGL